MRRGRGELWARALAVVALTAGAGRAQPGGGDTFAAETLFVEGKRLMAEGKYAEACPKLADSQRLDPGVGTLLYLADCYEKSGRTATAWLTFRQAATAAKAAGQADREKIARDRAAALDPTLSRVVLAVAAADTPGLEVRLDGRPIDRALWGVAMPADPGERVLVATAPRRRIWKTTLQVAAGGATARVEVPALEPEAAAVPAQPAPAPADPGAAPPPGRRSASVEPREPAAEVRPGGTERTVALVLAGLGVASAGVGVIFGLRANSRHDESRAFCNGTECTDQRGIDLVDEGRSSAAVANVGFAAGGVLVAAGAVLFLTAPSGPGGASTAGGVSASSGASNASRAPNARSAWVAPILSHGAAGLAAGARW